ncbi:hypothetical protein KW791_01495 [Candidatus Parcubacteria bacterium]|nr:hypothetical protein [Candidatus Parcubacteria bacterium]
MGILSQTLISTLLALTPLGGLSLPASSPEPTPGDISSLACLVPSKLRCNNQESLDATKARFADKGILGSELAQNEIALCQKEIKDYQDAMNVYNLNCPAQIKSQINSYDPGKYIPYLASYICGSHFGQSSYDKKSGMCQCENGYFLQDEKCQLGTIICQKKYGTGAIAKNGMCIVLSETTPILTSSIFSNCLPKHESIPNTGEYPCLQLEQASA